MTATEAVLAKPGHGIPTVTQVSKGGWRVQDKNNLQVHVDAERKKSEKLTREKLTLDRVAELASLMELSNDAVMKLGGERLAKRIKLTEMSKMKYWKELLVPEGEVGYKYILKKALESMPKFDETLGEGQVRTTKTNSVRRILQCTSGK